MHLGRRGTGAREYYYAHAQAAGTAPAPDRMAYAEPVRRRGASKMRKAGTQAAGAQGLPTRSGSGSAPARRGTPAVRAKSRAGGAAAGGRIRLAAEVDEGMAGVGVALGDVRAPARSGRACRIPAWTWYAIRVSAQRWPSVVRRDERARVPYHFLRRGRMNGALGSTS